MIGTRARILLLSGAVLGLSVLCYLALRHPASNASVSKAYAHDVASGMRVWDPQTGVDSIRFESCRIEKMKSGPITFGGLDILCVNGLVVNLPLSDLPLQDKTGKNDESVMHEDAIGCIPKSLLRKAALPFERVSGVRIKGLAVNRIVGWTEEPVFTADEMRNHGRSLVLTNCRIFDDGKTNFVRKATLKTEPYPVLAWNGGERRLDDLFKYMEKMK